MQKQYQVVGAIITDENQNIFCTRRKVIGEDALKWEFPGGKARYGETHQDALRRYIKEDLNIDISIQDHFLTINYECEQLKIKFFTYICKSNETKDMSNDQIEGIWKKKSELLELDWADPDLIVVQEFMWDE